MRSASAPSGTLQLDMAGTPNSKGSGGASRGIASPSKRGSRLTMSCGYTTIPIGCVARSEPESGTTSAAPVGFDEGISSPRQLPGGFRVAQPRAWCGSHVDRAGSPGSFVDFDKLSGAGTASAGRCSSRSGGRAGCVLGPPGWGRSRFAQLPANRIQRIQTLESYDWPVVESLDINGAARGPLGT
jgi:hypothetical protein